MIIFLFGEEIFLSTEKLSEIKNKFISNNDSGAGLSIIDFEEDNVAKFTDQAVAGGLFSEKKLIVSKNLLAGATSDIQNEVLDFLKEEEFLLNDKDVMIVFWENSVPKKNGKLFKYLEKNSKKQNFEKLNGAKLAKWTTEKISEANPENSISKKTLDKLIAYSGGDLFALDNEIKKLTSFRNKGEISGEDIDVLVKSKIESNIFETIEALSSGNKKLAASLLHSQLEKGEDAFYIFSMYVYQFRNLLKIGEFSGEGMQNQYQIAKEVGLHPFVVQKGLAQARNTGAQTLKNIYKKLQDLDIRVKTGKTDINLALDKFIAEI